MVSPMSVTISSSKSVLLSLSDNFNIKVEAKTIDLTETGFLFAKAYGNGSEA